MGNQGRVRVGVRFRYGAYRVLTTKSLRSITRRIGTALANTGRLRFRNDPTYNGEHLLRTSVLALAKDEESVVVFDVGANVGDWSHSLITEAAELEVADRLRLTALEPTHDAFAVLVDRLRDSEIKSLDMRQCAASDAEGSLSMNIYGARYGINSLEAPPADDDIPIIEMEQVVTTTIPTLANEKLLSTLHLLKIDTEGHDLRVLTGALELFEQERIWVAQFEYNRRWIPGRHLLFDVFDLLKDTPYAVGYLSPRGVVWTPRWDSSLEDWYESNYVIAHKRLVARLPTA